MDVYDILYAECERGTKGCKKFKSADMLRCAVIYSMNQEKAQTSEHCTVLVISGVGVNIVG